MSAKAVWSLKAAAAAIEPKVQMHLGAIKAIKSKLASAKTTIASPSAVSAFHDIQAVPT